MSLFGSRFHRNWRKPLALALLAAWIGLRLWQETPPRGPPELTAGPHTIAEVIDGDTLLLENHARVRLLGADTPETKHPRLPPQAYGEEAAEFTRQFVAGRTLRLEFDVERRDRYGRYLAYVYVDDRLLNEELIRAGLARAMPQYPYARQMKDRFLSAEAAARAARRKLWSQPSGPVEEIDDEP